MPKLQIHPGVLIETLRSLWRNIFPSSEVREVRAIARGFRVIAQVEKGLLDEGSPAHLAAHRARELAPDNPLTTVYNLWTAHSYARTLQPMSLDPAERLAEALFEALALHVIVTGIDPDTGRYPATDKLAEILSMTDPEAILALMADSPDKDVRATLRLLKKERGAEVAGAVTTMRWRYTEAVRG
jgi:hypothetical protein